MLITEIKRVIDQVSRDKGIETDVLIQALEEAIRSAARKKFGNRVDMEVKFNEELGEIEVFQFKDVVEDVTDPDTQLTLEDGQSMDPDCEIGDSLGTKMDTSTFGRIAAQSAKQVIIQKMKDAERDAVYNNFIDRKGEIINGIVQRIERGNTIVNLGQTEGILPEREKIQKESYRRGDRIRAYILDVYHESRGPQITLSRSHPAFLISLFKTEVPEISEGIVNIVGAVRESGSRAKIAVSSQDSDIDPVGACVGMKGSRVQNVVQELRGEKIDIIPWHVDPAKFVCNALAPAEISRVIIDEEHRSMEVIVPDEFLSVAIGKRGQNVRLASKLTRWRLDVKSESRYSRDMRDGYESLVAMPDVGISLADALYEKGFFSADELSRATVDDLLRVRGMTESEAEKLIELAKDHVLHLADAESRPRVVEAPEPAPMETDLSASDDADAVEMTTGQDDPVTSAEADSVEGPDAGALAGDEAAGSLEESSSDETPADEEVSDEAMADEETSDETPDDEEVSEEAMADEETSDETPADEETSDEAPADENASDETPDDEEVSEPLEAETTGGASVDADAPMTDMDNDPSELQLGEGVASEDTESAPAEPENGDGPTPDNPVADPKGDGQNEDAAVR